MTKTTLAFVLAFALPLSLLAAGRVAPGSTVFIEPTENGAHIALAAAIAKKKVPVTVVTTAERADYVISIVGDYQKAGFGKLLLSGGNSRGEAHASMTVASKSGDIAFAYNVDKGSAARGMQSAVEACAKHLNEHIKGKE
jgi:dihydrodipicolinate synthase/N-acetylneuraminate lyase